MTSHNPPTSQQLDGIERLIAAATEGPWHLTDADTIVAPLTGHKIADVWEPTPATRNGEFIETARTAMPLLLAEVRRLNAELATERRQHEFTMRQRNERSVRLLHLRDLADAEDIDGLLAAARDVLAASVNDHAPAAGSV